MKGLCWPGQRQPWLGRDAAGRWGTGRMVWPELPMGRPPPSPAGMQWLFIEWGVGRGERGVQRNKCWLSESYKKVLKYLFYFFLAHIIMVVAHFIKVNDT